MRSSDRPSRPVVRAMPGSGAAAVDQREAVEQRALHRQLTVDDLRCLEAGVELALDRPVGLAFEKSMSAVMPSVVIVVDLSSWSYTDLAVIGPSTAPATCANTPPAVQARRLTLFSVARGAAFAIVSLYVTTPGAVDCSDGKLDSWVTELAASR